MMYVLVGPDGGGKSTLASSISKATGYPVIHRSKPETEQERLEMLDMYLHGLEDNIILDRAWYCEMVYGNVMRDKAFINAHEMLTIEAAILARGIDARIIHCTDTTHKLWERCMFRGEEYIQSISQLNAIKEGYERVMHKMSHLLPVIRYEVND